MSDPVPPAGGFAPGRHPIDGYGAQGFRFAGMVHPGSILALPSGIRAWDVAAIADISAVVLAPILAERDEIEILLIGCGMTRQYMDFIEVNGVSEAINLPHRAHEVKWGVEHITVNYLHFS